MLLPVSVATFLEVLESNHYTHRKQQMFSPPYATTGGGVPDKSTQFSGFFVFKQGLIKLHSIQKKEMYQRIQPETRLYIVEGWGRGEGGITAYWEREHCNWNITPK